MSRAPWKLGSTSTLEVLDHAPTAIVATTIGGQILFANRRALAMFGREAGELDDQTFDRLLAAPAWPTRADLWQRYRTELGPWDDLRLRGVHRDGSELALRVSLSHTHGDGAPILIASIQRDHGLTNAEVDALRARADRMESITDRKQAEDTLKAAEAHTRALLSAIPDMMFRMNRNGDYLDYKAEGRSDLLVAAEQIIGTNLRDLPMPPELIERFTAALAHVLTTGELATLEYDMDIAGASYRYEVRMSKSGPDEVVSIVRDITERTRSEKRIKELNRRLARRNRELQAANRELESFSYSVSHDLRAPLRAIDGFSMVLERQHGEALSEHARGLLSRVRAAAQRMSGLIDDLLCLSRITQSDLSYEQIDISALAGEVIEGLRATQPERQVEEVIAPGVTCLGDPSMLRILFDNVLGNAWKYTSLRPHARIELGITTQDGEQVYFVRDNGAGFDMQYAKKLFAAFQRLHTSHEFPGNGIGLATAARVVQRHGGRIWAEAAVDQGASFYFTLAAENEE